MITSIKILPRMAVHSLADDDYYSKSVMASLPDNDGIRLISLNGSDEEFLNNEQIEYLQKFLNFTFINSFRFDDIGGAIWESIVKRHNVDRSKFIEFTEDMAEEIKLLIDTPYEPLQHFMEASELLIVHCHAGISRSAAIGAAIAFHLNLDSIKFRSMNPNIDPNPFILAKMLKVLGYSEAAFYGWRNKNNRFE